MKPPYLTSLSTTLLLLALTLTAQAQKIFYVTTTGGTTPTSASTTQASPSWVASTTDLQGAINAANNGDQVWIAQGLYKPANPLQMKNGVAIYGGFVGNEIALNARPAINPVTGNPSGTTISGDGNKRVFYHPAGTNLTNSAVLNGVIITGGKSDQGGGMYNNGSDPTLTNCSFLSNSATGGTSNYGGAMANAGSSPTLTNCLFQENEASGGTQTVGGAIDNLNSSPTLTNCSFLSNSATGGTRNYGGAITNDNSNPILTNCSFQENEAFGGTQTTGGAVYNINSSSPILTNCSFQGNEATGGTSNLGVALHNTNSSSPTLINCVLWNNGGVRSIRNSNSAMLTAQYCLFEADETDYTGSNNLTTSTSPFVSATSVALSPCSPAINAGDPNSQTAATGPYSATALPQTDLVGNPRIFGVGLAYQRVDLGAVEFQAVGGPVASFTLSLAGSPTATCVASPTLTLNGSQTGVNYQLRRDGANAGGLVTGTGNALSFGPQSLSGIYSVLATNTSCSVVMEGSVTVVSDVALPAASLASAPSTTLTCNPTSVTLTATASVSALQWSHGPTNTSALTIGQVGSYWVTATAPNGCSITSNTIVVSQNIAPPSLTLTPGSGTLTCPNPSLTLVAQTNASSLTWTGGSGPVGNSNTLMVNASDSYTITVTGANGCTTSATASVVSNTGLMATLTASNTGLCAGESALLTASGGINYRFSSPGGLIQNGATPTLSATQTGTYSVAVTGANGCTAIRSILLTASPAPTAQLSFLNGGRTVQITGGISYHLVQPIDRINGYEIRETASSRDGFFDLKRPGPFWVIVTSANGCSTRVDGVSQ